VPPKTKVIHSSSESDWHFAERGSGMPVVLVHAFPLNNTMWSEQMDLGRGVRMLAPDLPGFGQTPAAGEELTIAGAAAALHDRLASLRALPCVMGGCSMGGYISLAFARAFPKDLRGLLLIDTRCESDSAEARVGREKTIELLRTSGSKAIADTMVGKLLSEGSLTHRPALVKQVRQMIESTPAATIEAALRALRDRPDQTDLLPSIAVPAMVIVGEHDVLTPPAAAETMRRGLPHAELRVIAGAGHLSPMEQSRQVNAAIGELVDLIVAAN
jgi:3-oxoadipate enol-lactonase